MITQQSLILTILKILSVQLTMVEYRIIPNKRAGRGDEVGGAFIMCTKMLICISRSHSAAAPSLSHATLARTHCTCKPPSTLKAPHVRAGIKCN